MISALQGRISQEEFGSMVGISQPRVAQLISEGVLEREATAGRWLLAYCERLREQAAGRGQELTVERTALARSQRIAQDIKNAVARAEYAPIGLLADVLGVASSAVVDRFDQLEGGLRKACPDLPDAARTTIQKVIASARNEWIRSTAKLVEQRLDELDELDDGDDVTGVNGDDDVAPPAA